ncbi:hypothetical protein P7F88_25505 [Vibrio hannami]|uniref:hypothetical protein n=1 Tax=Vibrio hannami TaxID=2717094 RepID=UPI00240F8A5F|nr:hypothetical protein [Vibrio hannami]MDG3089223.1 hypothetical protein [Vibrio hannami]
MAQTIIPGLRAAGALQPIEEATSGFASQGGKEAQAEAWLREAEALEAELPVLQEADPDAARNGP